METGPHLEVSSERLEKPRNDPGLQGELAIHTPQASTVQLLLDTYKEIVNTCQDNCVQLLLIDKLCKQLTGFLKNKKPFNAINDRIIFIYCKS